MGRYITSPEDNIRFNVFLNIISHGIEERRWDVATKRAKFSSLISNVCWETINSSATKDVIAVLVGSSSVFKVNMKIGKLYHFQSFSGRIVLFNFFVKAINV